MMKLSQRWRWAMGCLGAVPLADKCLILMMVILLAQSGYSLFSLDFQESNMIDVVIRTTSSAIFGYFISANFLAGGRAACDINPPEPVATAADPSVPNSAGKPKAGIGFHADGGLGQLQSGYTQSLSEPLERENRFQVLVVALIGIAALLLLIVARNSFATNSFASATLSQLRDFVSGSVGFLLGHTTHRPKPAAL